MARLLDRLDRPVLLYDGECALCSRVVRFLVKHDTAGRLKYAALQTEIGRQLLDEAGLDPEFRQSVVLIDGDRRLVASDAAVAALAYLDRPWRWLAAGKAVPRFLREPAYELVSRYRFKVFGHAPLEQLPAPEQPDRFVDQGLGKATEPTP